MFLSYLRSGTSTFAKDACHLGMMYRREHQSVLQISILRKWKSSSGKICHVTVDDISAAVGFSHGTVHTIIVDALKFRKVSVQWVLHNFTPEQEVCCMACLCNCCSFMTTFSEQLSAVMKVGATSLNSNCNGKVCYRSTQIPLHKKKFKTFHTSAGKVMLSFLFDYKGPLLVGFLEHRATMLSGIWKH